LDKGSCARIVEANLSERVDAFFVNSNGNDHFIDYVDLNMDNNIKSDSVSINIDTDYAYMLEVTAAATFQKTTQKRSPV
jgi:hypothetical protein